MKQHIVVLLVGVLFACGFLSGCSEQNNLPHGLDSRLVGQWQNQQTMEILEFRSDGSYLAEEGELANWSTQEGGRLWMYGVLYSYNLSEENTVLTITVETFPRTYRRV